MEDNLLQFTYTENKRDIWNLLNIREKFYASLNSFKKTFLSYFQGIFCFPGKFLGLKKKFSS